MVLACDLHRRQRPPLPGGRVPLLGRIDAGVQVDEPGAGRITARREHRAVGEHGQVVLPAPKAIGAVVETTGVGPFRSTTRGVLARGTAARDEHLPDVEERMAAVVAVDRVPLPQRLPRPGAGGVERTHRLVGTGIERAPVRGDVHPRVEGQAERSGAERPQPTRKHPNLGRVDVTRGDQHLAVPQRRHGRIPAPGRHVRTKAPRVGRGLEEVRLNDAIQLLVLVPAREEHPTVEQMRQPAAEDVEAGIHVDRRLNPRHRIPHGRTRVSRAPGSSRRR